MLEEQIQLNTADRQLLFDIRSEMRKQNELLAQLLEALCPIAKDIVPKEAKPRVSKPKITKPKTDKPKGGKKDAKNK